MDNLKKVKLVVLLGVVFVSFSSILTKATEASPLIIALYRLMFATFLLLPIIIKGHKKEISNVSKRTFMWCFISGVFLALHFTTWMTSIKITSIASSTTLVNTHPIFIVMGSILFLKVKYPRVILFSIGIALTGSVIISGSDMLIGDHMFYGDMLAIAGGFFVAGYMMIGSFARQNLSVNTYTFLVYGSCTVTLLIFVLITGTPLYPYGIKDWAIFISLAVFCTLMGHSIFNWALEFLNPALISTAILGEPVLATIWAVLIFGEAPTYLQVLGGATIILGIVLYISNDKKIELEEKAS